MTTQRSIESNCATCAPLYVDRDGTNGPSRKNYADFSKGNTPLAESANEQRSNVCICASMRPGMKEWTMFTFLCRHPPSAMDDAALVAL